MTSESRRGFASWDPEKLRDVARRGGRAAHQSGKTRQYTSEEARRAGRKGGQVVSRDREHMARIGRLGGLTSSARRQVTEG
ncbi:MAG: KGG domain-containing protein [Patescibacteria group bacterium]